MSTPKLITFPLLLPAASSSSIKLPESPCRLLSVFFRLTTDANVANRLAGIVLTSYGQTVGLVSSLVQQAAGVTWNYTFTIGTLQGADFSGLRIALQLPQIILPAGSIVAVTVDNAQVTDSLSEAVLLYEAL